MAMTCSICNHPKRLEIDREIVQGKSHQKIAREFGVDNQAVWRHAQNHLSHQLVTAYQQKDLAENMELLNRIDKILHKAEDIFDRNYQQKRDGLALKALSEQRQTIELLAKISYALHQVQALKSQESADQRFAREHYEDTETAKLIIEKLNRSERRLLDKLHQKLEGELPEDYDITDEFRVDYENELLFSIESKARKGAPDDLCSCDVSPLTSSEEGYPDPEPRKKKKMRRTKFPEDKLKVRDPESHRPEPIKTKTKKRNSIMK